MRRGRGNLLAAAAAASPLLSGAGASLPPAASASARTSAASRGARGDGARQNAKFGPAPPVWNGGEPPTLLARLRPPPGEAEPEASARKKVVEADDTAADDMALRGGINGR